MAGESRFNGRRATPSSSRLRHSFGIEFDRSFVPFLYEITKDRSWIQTKDVNILHDERYERKRRDIQDIR